MCHHKTSITKHCVFLYHMKQHTTCISLRHVSHDVPPCPCIILRHHTPYVTNRIIKYIVSILKNVPLPQNLTTTVSRLKTTIEALPSCTTTATLPNKNVNHHHYPTTLKTPAPPLKYSPRIHHAASLHFYPVSMPELSIL